MGRAALPESDLPAAAAIYRLADRRARARADVAGLRPEVRELALWLVQAVGDPAVAGALRASPGAVAAGAAALRAGTTILADSRMVAAGLDWRRLPPRTRVMHWPTGGLDGAARRSGQTRAAAAVERWPPWLGGAVVAIGNAPTALARLLAGLRAGWDRPALVLGFPVGFVGAARAKAELAALPDVPFVTLAGSRGGSPLAVAALHGLLRG